MKRLFPATLLALSLTLPQAQAADDIVDTAVKAGKFKTLVTAVKAAGLVDTLKSKGPFTVFAPTDAAFAKLPHGTVANLVKPENKATLTSILTYHVVSGRVSARDALNVRSAPTVNGQSINLNASLSGMKVNGATIVMTDIHCSNGVIHVIDAVIMPSTKNIPETAAKAGSFSTLLAAAKAAGLVDALSGKGPITVFAPTDAAFAKLPKGTVENLLRKENRAQLAAILKYHVIPGRVRAADAIKAGSAKTLQGQKIMVGYGADGVRINDAKVVTPNIETTNGVIHVIDSVILPKKTVAARHASTFTSNAAAPACKAKTTATSACKSGSHR